MSSPAYEFENKNYHPIGIPERKNIFDNPGFKYSEKGWGCIEESVDIEHLADAFGIPDDKRAEFVESVGKFAEDDPYSTPFAEKVLAITDAIAEILVTKHAAYGNSTLDPIRVFSDLDPEAGLLVRIDDKLSRVARGYEIPAEDTIDDLIGYLILLKIARMED